MLNSVDVVSTEARRKIFGKSRFTRSAKCYRNNLSRACDIFPNSCNISYVKSLSFFELPVISTNYSKNKMLSLVIVLTIQMDMYSEIFLNVTLDIFLRVNREGNDGVDAKILLSPRRITRKKRKR